ncbi:MAG: hypothetical protein JNK82_30710 [Myxococcaceae bacterium]|nr:hypothetical protein [Myxococcaceae bacterium]
MRRGLALTFCLFSSLALAADAGALHKKAKSRMKSLDFDAALPLLEQLKGDGSLPAAQKAEVLVDLGITHVNLGQVEEAKRNFDEALGFNEGAKPPSSASPKVQRVFEEARDARQLKLSPPPPTPAPAEPPPRPQKAKLVPEPTFEPPIGITDPPMPKPRMVVLPAILAAAGVASIAAGAFLAVETQNLAARLQGSLHPSAEVMSIQSRRSTFGTLAYVGYGLGAALLIAAAVLFVFSGGN